MVRARTGGGSGLVMFATEMRAFRQKAGLSQADLAAKLNYSESLVASIETLRRAPTLDVARHLDEALDTPGLFARLQQNARKEALPGWFQPYADIEATATQLWLFEHSLVPGLLQTEDYARVLLSGRPNTTTGEVEELVPARMERQRILDRPEPPLLWAVIDEAALHRQAGDSKITCEQLFHLAELSLRPNINIQVVPSSAGVHYALSGAFAIVETDDARVGYLETALEGYIVEAPSTVAAMMLTFDTVRTETLSRSASRQLIRRIAEESYGPE